MTQLLTQTEARQLAKLLNAQTGLIHVAHTIPEGCWGGTERGWGVSGPAATELQIEQARMRAQLIDDARARLRQAERADDWRAQAETIERLDYLGETSP